MNEQHLIKRFISYVTVDTESDPNNPAFPSSEKQWNLVKQLEENCGQSECKKSP